MRSFLLILLLSVNLLLKAQENAVCIEKSSRNSYYAGKDTSLVLLKAVSQNGSNKILLFTLRSTINSRTIPTIAKVNVDGDIIWSRALVSQAENFDIRQFDAIALHDNTFFVFFIAQSLDLSSPQVNCMLWLDENGIVIRQNNYSIKNDPTLQASSSFNTKLTETSSGNILFMTGYTFQNNSQSQNIVLIGNLNALGNLQWAKFLQPSAGGYTPVDLVSYRGFIIIQGLSQKTLFPYNAIFNSTKLNLSDGEVVSSISKRDNSYFNGSSSALGVSILTDDHKIKTLVSYRIPDYYQIYFSFTQDTSFNLLRSTTFYTASNAISYLPVSATLNKKGMSLIKSHGGEDPTNLGYFIADINDSILQERKVDNFPVFGQYSSFWATEVAFDSADSFYMYWNGKKDDKNMVGWIKSSLHSTGGICSVKDSSFIQSANYPMLSYDWQLNPYAESILEPVSFSIAIFRPIIKNELVCEKITGFCNPIKIRPLDTICNIVDPVRITVFKNPECNGRILFNFDTTAITNWQQVNDTLLLLQFNQSWNGKIYASSSFCPSIKDSVLLIVKAPLPVINLGNDSILCTGDTLRLHAGTGFSLYKWQNGTTDSFYSATEGGIYYVTARDACGRLYSDTIRVQLVNKKLTVNSAASICKKDNIQLTAAGNFTSITWSPLYNISNLNGETVIVHPEITTRYNITAITSEGCEVKDTVLVIVKYCPFDFFMPTAFTP
ncbi:MAG: hypothetical protein ABUL41_02390, partial [Chitinophagaceae bacterium]